MKTKLQQEIRLSNSITLRPTLMTLAATSMMAAIAILFYLAAYYYLFFTSEVKAATGVAYVSLGF